METFNLLKQNFKYFLFTSAIDKLGGNGGDGGSSGNKAEQLKNIEISKEAKIAKIKEYIEGNKLVSLDDNEDLKNELLQKLVSNKLDDKQIDTIYSELQKIANIEDQTFTPEVMAKIEKEAVKDKFEKVQVQIRKIQKESYIDHIKEIVEAENLICKTLGDCSGVEKAKKEALAVSKEAQNELSTEKLQTITNNEFLKISPENRLQYITKNNVKSEQVANGTTKNLEFSFTFNGKFNRELWLKTTAGQVLPSEVRELVSNGIIYKRTGLKGEFFSEENRRLIINEGTKINNIKIGDITNLEKQDNQKINEFLDSNPETTKYKDIVFEAIKRNIDPDFAILVFSGKIKDMPIISMQRKVVLEDMFTEFDRLRPLISMWNGKKLDNGKYPDQLVIELFKKFGGKTWRQKVLDYGISEKEIKRVENLNYPRYLSLNEKNRILSKVPFDVKKAIESVFPSNEVENAILVTYGESGFKTSAFRDSYKNSGGGNDLGLFQINDKYHPEVRDINWEDPYQNAKLAYKIFKQAGNSWKPWYAAKKIGLA